MSAADFVSWVLIIRFFINDSLLTRENAFIAIINNKISALIIIPL